MSCRATVSANGTAQENRASPFTEPWRDLGAKECFMFANGARNLSLVSASDSFVAQLGLG
jgi:hypothetical protein